MPLAGVSENINHKLGPGIYAWSVPADAETCVGASALCAARCYAKHGFFVYPATQRFLARNKEFAQTPEFVGWMLGELKQRFVKVFRIHVSGDFFNEEYTRKWLTIARELPRIRFFAYTRSWRDETIFPSLIQMGQLPNFRLWFSQDRLTGNSPFIPNIRRAYMAVNDLDASTAPPDCDLVFRDRPRTVMKRANGVLVCPAENGVQGKMRHTCTTCQVCWFPNARANWEYELPTDTDDGIEINAPEEVPCSC